MQKTKPERSEKKKKKKHLDRIDEPFESEYLQAERDRGENGMTKELSPAPKRFTIDWHNRSLENVLDRHHE